MLNIEPLESRCLLSATITGGTLLVTGTDARDSISVALNPSGSRYVVRMNGDREVFLASGVERVEIDAGAGNDRIVVGQSGRRSATAVPVRIDAGGGNDRVIGSHAPETIFGRDGRDTLSGGRGHDVIRGGDGDDRIFGGTGNDTLYGEAGNDALFGGSGRDTLYGGSDADVLVGGAGVDRLVGGGGIDLLDGRLERTSVTGAVTGNVTTTGSSTTINASSTGISNRADVAPGGTNSLVPATGVNGSLTTGTTFGVNTGFNDSFTTGTTFGTGFGSTGTTIGFGGTGLDTRTAPVGLNTLVIA
jgi:hypothetical protein